MYFFLEQNCQFMYDMSITRKKGRLELREENRGKKIFRRDFSISEYCVHTKENVFVFMASYFFFLLKLDSTRDI